MGNVPIMSKDPGTPEQWQEAVDLAHTFILLDAARSHGLVSGGPGVNLARCEEILARGAGLGYTPREEAVDAIVAELVRL